MDKPNNMSGRGRTSGARGRGRGCQTPRGGQRSGRVASGGRGRGRGRGRGQVAEPSQNIDTSTQASDQQDPPPSPWAKSRAKERARELLSDPTSYVHGMPATHVYFTDALFVRYDKKNFASNYNNLKKTLETEKLCIEFDKLALTNFNERNPRPPLTDKGVPFWDTSAAKSLVIEEIKSGALDGLTPQQVRDRHDEYKLFPLRDFRQFLNMEKRNIREAVYWQAKRNRKGRRQHEVEVENSDT